MTPIIIDGILPDPAAYRRMALAQPFSNVCTPAGVFRGIAQPPDDSVPDWIRTHYPELMPTLSFLRLSPAGQHEPTYVHTDEDMGEFTAILYLNPDPPAGDGTSFPSLGQHVDARFGRLALFQSSLPHARGLFDNYGVGPEDARLIQVTFGVGLLRECD